MMSLLCSKTAKASQDLPPSYPLTSSPITLSLSHSALAILAILLFLIYSSLLLALVFAVVIPQIAASTSNSLYKYHFNKAHHKYPT